MTVPDPTVSTVPRSSTAILAVWLIVVVVVVVAAVVTAAVVGWWRQHRSRTRSLTSRVCLPSYKHAPKSSASDRPDSGSPPSPVA